MNTENLEESVHKLKKNREIPEEIQKKDGESVVQTANPSLPSQRR